MSLDTAQHFDAISLHIVKAEIDASLAQVEGALSAFIEDNSSTFGLNEAVENMNQIHGVIQLLEITGASDLSDAMSKLLAIIAGNPGETTHAQLSAMSEGLMMLSRYLEFVLLRENQLPQFLLPSINTIRQQLKLPLLREGHFLNAYLSIVQVPKLQFDNQQADVSDKQWQQLLSLYKASLSRIIKKQANSLDYKAISLVGYFAHAKSKATPSALYWYAASNALSDLNQCQLSDTRLRVLVQVERALASFTKQPNEFVPSLDDMSDILSLAGCRDHQESAVLREQLGLDDYLMNDTESSLLARYLFGPDSNTIHITTQLMHEQIADIKNKIDSLQHGDQVDVSFNDIAEQIYQVSQALSLLNLKDAAEVTRKQSSIVSQWRDLNNMDQVNALMDALLFTGNQLSMLDRQYIAGADTLPFNNPYISLPQLDEANTTVIQECRDSLALSMSSLTAYLESGDVLNMNNVPAMFESIAGAMLFINAPLGHEILNGAAQYVAKAFAPDQQKPNDQHIALLANAIMSVDHYLESLQQRKPISIHPFDVGLESAKQLMAA